MYTFEFHSIGIHKTGVYSTSYVHSICHISTVAQQKRDDRKNRNDLTKRARQIDVCMRICTVSLIHLKGKTLTTKKRKQFNM